MAFPYVFGDSYGGVQGAQQADVNSDRNYALSLMAAQQRAMQLAQEQQNSLFNQAQANVGLQAQMQQKEADRRLAEELGLGGLAEKNNQLQNQLTIAAEKIASGEKLARDKAEEHAKYLMDTGTSLGPDLASTMGKLIQEQKDAETAAQKAEADYVGTLANVKTLEAQGHIKQVKGADRMTYKAVGDDATNSVMQASAEKLTSDLVSKAQAMKEANQKKVEAERALRDHARILDRNRFAPGPDSIIFTPTGTPFKIPGLQTTNSPPIPAGIRQVDPVTGALLP